MNNKIQAHRFKLFAVRRHVRAFVALLISIIFASQVLACDTSLKKTGVLIGQFSKGATKGWMPVTFSKKTDYRLVNIDNTTVLRANSRDSASGLIYRQKIDLAKTPLLHWCWRVEQILKNDREQSHEGDDFAARLYLIIGGGLLPWQTRALNYVWSSQLPVGELWPNPYGGKRAMMLTVRSNSSPAATWFAETRNVYEDLERAFAQKFRYIDAIAIMTDTDNTDAAAQSYYGDIYFSAP